MIKKTIAIIALFMILSAASLAAQSNTLSAGAGVGFNTPVTLFSDFRVKYEHALNTQWALAVQTACQVYPFARDSIDSKHDIALFGFVFIPELRWYPAGSIFHVDAGVGYGYYLGKMHSLVIAPSLGWRFALGAAQKLILDIGIKNEIFVPLSENIIRGPSKRMGDFIPVNWLPCLALGYTF